MSGNERPPAPEYRTARIASALLLFALVAATWLLDAIRTDFEVSPFILVPVLLTAAGLLAVDVPGLRNFRNGK